MVSCCLIEQKPRYECLWRIMDSAGSDGQLSTDMKLVVLPSCSAWEVPRDSVTLGKALLTMTLDKVMVRL